MVSVSRRHSPAHPGAHASALSSAAGSPERALAHNAWDDAYGLFIGVLFAAMGISLLAKGGLIAGGIAGMALLASNLTGWAPAPLVPLINVPFILFAFCAMGRFFGLKSLLVSAAIGLGVGVISQSLDVASVPGGFAAIAGGTILGMGILCLARHNASMGGTGALTLWIQRRYAFNAGLTQLGFDLALFALAAAYLPLAKILWSVLGTVAMNAMLIAWHKPGRYRG
ncbi:YitT family protein [Bordetella genomosp. 13]|uniref:YitT family protein n=1 Tax=Bordetella genomosp. 13 TaxID=463040 RepID=UPI0011A9B1C4|nr:YitT family protein [Bordetella genomosp. 13]